MGQISVKITQLEELQTKIMQQPCNCDAINRKLAKVVDIEDDIGALCCPKCCSCHWDKMIDQLEWEG